MPAAPETFEGRTTVRALLLAMCVVCMAAACSESHLDATSPETFRTSMAKMHAEHDVSEALEFGEAFEKVRAADGDDVTRHRMNDMNYAQARSFLFARVEQLEASKKESSTR